MWSEFFSQGNKIFDANVSAISVSVETSSGMRKLYLNLVEDADSIPIGSSGRAEIIKLEKDRALLIPSKALVGDFVVVEKNGIAKFHKVVTGARNLLTVEVIEGIKEGDKVVVETPHVLNNGDRIKSTVVGFSENRLIDILNALLRIGLAFHHRAKKTDDPFLTGNCFWCFLFRDNPISNFWL